jgi:mono/diheme cytochrome c family protein
MKSAVLKTLLVLSASAFASSALAAEESGNVRDGQRFAQTVCAECHAVRDGERTSPNNKAPTFTNVANTPGMNAMALEVWFQTPHPTMPNLKFSNEESDNVIAYILSLRKRP